MPTKNPRIIKKILSGSASIFFGLIAMGVVDSPINILELLGYTEMGNFFDLESISRYQTISYIIIAITILSVFLKYITRKGGIAAHSGTNRLMEAMSTRMKGVLRDRARSAQRLRITIAITLLLVFVLVMTDIPDSLFETRIIALALAVFSAVWGFVPNKILDRSYGTSRKK